MKEVERKDLPEITGGQVSTPPVIVPCTPEFPNPVPGPIDPLGDGQRKVEV
jgi:hypothetical protein